MPDTCVFLLSYTLHELVCVCGGEGGGQPVMRYASLKGQSHINIYIRLINYAQMRFLRLLCSVLRHVSLQDSG